MRIPSPKFRVGDFVRFSRKSVYDWAYIVEKKYDHEQQQWSYRLDSSDDKFYLEEMLTLIA
jgi:hypothetical protein